MTTVLNKEAIRYTWKRHYRNPRGAPRTVASLKRAVRKREKLLNEKITLNRDGTVSFHKR